ncbi:hypothetical protein KP509_26G030800 [Ceratopteris richardii]|nr:hypothetical protein KP509_26G030800 [Ceratopteris richardii]
MESDRTYMTEPILGLDSGMIERSTRSRQLRKDQFHFNRPDENVQFLGLPTVVQDERRAESSRQVDFQSIINDLCILKQNHETMKRRLENAERALENHSLVDTGMYQGEATPAALQVRANAVKLDIESSSRAIIQFTINNGCPVEIPSHLQIAKEQVSPTTGPKQAQLEYLLMQASLCVYMFQGFESASYSTTMDINLDESFEPPVILKQKRLRHFSRFLDVDVAQMYKENRDFRHFAKLKISTILKSSSSETVSYTGTHRTEKVRIPKYPFYESLLRLAKSVWLLHEIAFACEPTSPEIFRVPPLSGFMEEYMKEQEDLLTARSSGVGERTVAFMTVPGFILRNSVIKADVCCFDALL